jgi:hypothetical protein
MWLKRAHHRPIPRYRSASALAYMTSLAGLWGLLDVCSKEGVIGGMQAG